ncbi:MAG TPA: Ig-like domain-containing protein [Fibrobacteria bacterium]|nr:Ig-like domain-containing protein [Fibrobacteria bacterium]
MKRSHRIALAVSTFLCLWACTVDNPVGTPATEIRFNAIADSLKGAGYDTLEISAVKPGMTVPVILYGGSLTEGPAPGLLTLPDSLGKTFTITVKAGHKADGALGFSKVYAIVDGAVSGSLIIVVPVDPGGSDSVPPTGVALAPESLSLAAEGDTATLKASVLPAKALQAVLWNSSNPAVAAVDARGAVRSGTEGKATVTAKAAADTSKLASIVVTVSKPSTVDSVKLDKKTLKVFMGAPGAALQAGVFPASEPALFNWRSSAPLVASVSADGKVSGLAEGEAFISVHYKSDETKSDTCRVTVVKDAPSLKAGQDVSIEVGATVTFAPTVEQEFGGIVEFKWSLDGDTLWDGTAVAIPANLSRTYTVAGDVYAYFSVKDGEGNVATAKRLIRVGNAAPLVVIDSPLEGAMLKATPATVVYRVNNTVLSRKVDLKEGPDTITIDTVINGAKGSATVRVTLDTQAPVVAITSPLANAKVATNPVAVIWTVDGVSQSAQTSETMTAGDGEKTIIRSFTDKAGNPGSAGIKVILDKDKPAAPLMNAAGTTASPTNAASLTWKWTSGDNGKGKGDYRYWLDTPAMPANPTPVSQGTQAVVPGLAEGIHTLYVQEADDQGNWSTAGSHPISIDRTGPALALEGGNRAVTGAAFTLSATASDPNSVASVAVAGAAGGNGAMTLNSGEYVANVVLAEGANVLTVTAKDNLGNAKAASVTITLNSAGIAIVFPEDGYVTSASPVHVQYDLSVGHAGTTKFADVPLTKVGANTVTVTDGGATRSVQVFYQPKVVFVRKGVTGGKGDGTSWEDAYGDILPALASARGSAGGNKLWVSAGVYTGNAAAYPGFSLAGGVSIYGGFPSIGRPATESARNFQSSKTTLKNAAGVQGYMLEIDNSGSSVVNGLAFATDGENGYVYNPGSGILSLVSCTFANSTTPDYFMFKLYGTVKIDSCILSPVGTGRYFIQGNDASITVTNTKILNGEATGILYLENSTLTMTTSTVTGNIFYRSPADKPSVGYIDPASTLTVTAPNTSDMPAFQKP